MIGSFMERYSAKVCYGSGGGSSGGGNPSSFSQMTFAQAVCATMNMVGQTPTRTADQACGTNLYGGNPGGKGRDPSGGRR